MRGRVSQVALALVWVWAGLLVAHDLLMASDAHAAESTPATAAVTSRPRLSPAPRVDRDMDATAARRHGSHAHALTETSASIDPANEALYSDADESGRDHGFACAGVLAAAPTVPVETIGAAAAIEWIDAVRPVAEPVSAAVAWTGPSPPMTAATRRALFQVYLI